MKKDFLAVSDYSPAELQDLLDLAVELKKEYSPKATSPYSKAKSWR